jgi:hypothetical protein
MLKKLAHIQKIHLSTYFGRIGIRMSALGPERPHFGFFCHFLQFKTSNRSNLIPVVI